MMRHLTYFLAASSALGALLSPRTLWAQPCPNYLGPTSTGVVTEPAIREASGLAASRLSPGVFWTHNDSGDGPRLFAISDTGALLATYTLTGVSANDWEDIAAGPCDGGKSCLYVGDVGNNSKKRDDQVIYRVEEPVIDTNAAPVVGTLEGATQMRVKYPYDEGIDDDNPDVEALLVHPTREGEVYLVTKEGTRARLLEATWEDGGEATFEHRGEFGVGLVTAGDWHPDGERFAIRSYARIYVFDLNGMSPGEAFAMASVDERIRGELQGESLAYGKDGASLWTLAEGVEQDLWRYDCEVPAEPMDMGVDAGADMSADMGGLEDAGGDAEDMPEPSSNDMGQSGESDGPDMPYAGEMDGESGNNSGSSGCSCVTLRASSPLAPSPVGGVALALLALVARRPRRPFSSRSRQR